MPRNAYLQKRDNEYIANGSWKCPDAPLREFYAESLGKTWAVYLNLDNDRHLITTFFTEEEATQYITTADKIGAHYSVSIGNVMTCKYCGKRVAINFNNRDAMQYTHKRKPAVIK